MSKKRMFSLDIVDTDLFLEMPQSSQNLYFHLSMRADDDGFISSPNKIMKIVNSSKNDMDILMIKKFIIPFESGVCVIRHWKINNYLRGDRYTPTIYKKEKEELLTIDDIYIKNDRSDLIGVPNDNHLVDAGKNSIEEYSIEKNRKEEKNFFVPENFLKNLEEMNFLDGSYPNIDKKRLLNTYIPPIIDYYKSKKKQIKIPKNIFRSRISKETSYSKNKFIVNKIIDESQFY